MPGYGAPRPPVSSFRRVAAVAQSALPGKCAVGDAPDSAVTSHLHVTKPLQETIIHRGPPFVLHWFGDARHRDVLVRLNKPVACRGRPETESVPGRREKASCRMTICGRVVKDRLDNRICDPPRGEWSPIWDLTSLAFEERGLPFGDKNGGSEYLPHGYLMHAPKDGSRLRPIKT